MIKYYFISLLFALISLVSFSEIRKSSNAAFSITRNQNNNKYTAKDYIQNGLIAHWDGIENAGYGIHDDNPSIWKDLVKNYDLTIESGYFETNNYVVGNIRCAYNEISFPSNICTIEIVLLSKTKDISERIIFGTTPINSNAKGLRQVCWEYRHGIGFGYKGNSNSNLKGQINYYACTFKDYSQTDVTDGTPNATFFNGQFESYIGTSDYFSATYANHIAINPRYGTFSGNIYVIRLYSRMLTSSEIAYNYSIDKIRFGL